MRRRTLHCTTRRQTMHEGYGCRSSTKSFKPGTFSLEFCLTFGSEEEVSREPRPNGLRSHNKAITQQRLINCRSSSLWHGV
jgi:hypothetical protein